MSLLTLPQLPIHAVLPQLKAALKKGSAVLAAPPGSGKTTVIPLALLEESWLTGKKILILEPRRLATRAAAQRMSQLLNQPLGQQVGYQIRFDRCTSAQTRIEVVTEGILTRRLQKEGDLPDVGLVIFDEFHERSLHADLALALCHDLVQIRDDLRLLVMSATLDTAPIARLLGNVPIITGTGALHPVAINYLDRSPRGRISEVTSRGVLQLQSAPGDMLVFLPGRAEIMHTRELLTQESSLADRLILPLLGELSPQDQDRAIFPDPHGRQRIILATAIAETSLTIEGVRTVIDSGWSRLPRFHPATGLSHLTTTRVSRATADQRAGRAGRLGPGSCLRLWSKEEQHSLPPFHPPEIVHADLAPLALELALWGTPDPGVLRWLDPPREGSYNQACELLFRLQAIDDTGRITAHGRELAQLPLHPRLAHMLVLARKMGVESLGCDLAALLAERDPLPRAESSDISERLELVEIFRNAGNAGVRQRGGAPSVIRRIDQAARLWRHSPLQPLKKEEAALGSLLLAAFPERLAQQRSDAPHRYQLASGRGARLLPTDPLCGAAYIIAAQLDSGHKEGRIHLAAPLEKTTLLNEHAHLVTESEEIRWDMEKNKVVATARRAIGPLILEEHALHIVSQDALTKGLLQGIGQLGIEALPWKPRARQLQARVHCLRSWQQDEQWPDLTDTTLIADLTWLEPYLGGMRQLSQVHSLDLFSLLLSRLDWPRQKALEQLAPETITVPSGSTIRIDYSLEGPPVLAVRLQEMFGQTTTPRICNQQIPLLLHLLSPARRPIQVTEDLASFWQNGYPQVKKELKGRYPKHAWPDDPLKAQALRGVPKKRSTT